VSPKKTADRRSEQLLLRLTKSELEVLESVAHLERMTPNAYAYGLVSAHLARLRKQPHVAADLKNRRSYELQQAETASLPESTARAGRSAAGDEDDMHEEPQAPPSSGA
jgi:hypothetical protein